MRYEASTDRQVLDTHRHLLVDEELLAAVGCARRRAFAARAVSELGLNALEHGASTVPMVVTLDDGRLVIETGGTKFDSVAAALDQDDHGLGTTRRLLENSGMSWAYHWDDDQRVNVVELIVVEET